MEKRNKTGFKFAVFSLYSPMKLTFEGHIMKFKIYEERCYFDHKTDIVDFHEVAADESA